MKELILNVRRIYESPDRLFKVDLLFLVAEQDAKPVAFKF